MYVILKSHSNPGVGGGVCIILLLSIRKLRLREGSDVAE